MEQNNPIELNQNHQEINYLKIDSVNMAMINYSYGLGMSIDRWALVNFINGKMIHR
jgi:hypothetical protein